MNDKKGHNIMNDIINDIVNNKMGHSIVNIKIQSSNIVCTTGCVWCMILPKKNKNKKWNEMKMKPYIE